MFDWLDTEQVKAWLDSPTDAAGFGVTDPLNCAPRLAMEQFVRAFAKSEHCDTDWDFRLHLDEDIHTPQCINEEICRLGRVARLIVDALDD